MGILILHFKKTQQLERLFLFTSVKLVAKSVTPVGSSSAWNTVSNLTVKCHPTRPLEGVMMPSTLSSLRPVPVSTSQDVSSWILNQPSLMRSEPVPTDNCSTPSNWSPERKMPLTTSPEDITPLEEKLLTCAWTESESWLITVPVFKVSWYSKPSVVAAALVLVPFFWKDFPSTTAKNPNWVSPSTHPHRSQPPSLSHTTPSCPPTLFWSTLMSLLCWTTKPSMISAEDNWTLRAQPTLS